MPTHPIALLPLFTLYSYYLFIYSAYLFTYPFIYKTQSVTQITETWRKISLWSKKLEREWKWLYT